MQQGLGVATRLLFAFEDEVASGLVGCAGLKAGHVFVERVAFVLTVYHFSHAFQGFFDLRFAGMRDAVSRRYLARGYRGKVNNQKPDAKNKMKMPAF